MKCEHTIISQDTPLPPSIIQEIEDFWRQKDSNPFVWQSVRWIEFLLKSRQIQEGVCSLLYDKGMLCGYALTQVRSVGIGQFWAFILGGPSYHERYSESMFFFECEIRKYISDKNIVFLQYESLYERAITAPIGKWKSFIEKHTLELDLTFSSDELLAQMKPKGRYNIKLAEKQGVRVRKGDQLQDIESFIQLLEETLERDGFSGNSKFYYQTLLTSVHDPIEWLYVAEYEDQIIAAAILVRSGNRAIYYYGASTSDNAKRKYMPAYLLQWYMIEQSARAGCEIYDFLGIAPPDASDHSLSGVSEFKHKFWGRVVAYMPTQIQILKPWVYWLLRGARWLKSLV